MTNEEAIKYIEDGLSHHQDIYTGWDECIEFFEVAREALEKADKYRWHDLRKNPDDLPTISSGGYIVCIQHKGDYMKFYRQAGFICNCFFKAYEDVTKTIIDVIAWRKIEPFEEVDT